MVVACGPPASAGRGRAVGRDAVEGVGVAGLAGECGRGRRRRRLPDRVRAASVGDIDVVAGDPRAGAVGARPAHREGRPRSGRQRGHAATRRGDVDRVDDHGCIDRRVGVEDDRRLLIDRRSGRQARLGLDCVLNIALADAAAVVRRQEAVGDAGRGLAGDRVERGERRRSTGRSGR